MSNSPLSECSVLLSQNEKEEYLLTFQSRKSEILNDIMAVIYTQTTLYKEGEVEQRKVGIPANTKFSLRKQAKTRFLIKEQNRFHPLHCDRVAYFFARERQVFLKTKAGVVHRINESVEDIESTIDSRKFFRVNRSMVVAYSSVVEMVSLSNGKLCLTVTPEFETTVLVSKERAAAFKKWLDT